MSGEREEGTLPPLNRPYHRGGGEGRKRVREGGLHATWERRWRAVRGPAAWHRTEKETCHQTKLLAADPTPPHTAAQIWPMDYMLSTTALFYLISYKEVAMACIAFMRSCICSYETQWQRPLVFQPKSGLPNFLVAHLHQWGYGVCPVGQTCTSQGPPGHTSPQLQTYAAPPTHTHTTAVCHVLTLCCGLHHSAPGMGIGSKI